MKEEEAKKEEEREGTRYIPSYSAVPLITPLLPTTPRSLLSHSLTLTQSHFYIPHFIFISFTFLFRFSFFLLFFIPFFHFFPLFFLFCFSFSFSFILFITFFIIFSFSFIPVTSFYASIVLFFIPFTPSTFLHPRTQSFLSLFTAFCSDLFFPVFFPSTNKRHIHIHIHIHILLHSLHHFLSIPALHLIFTSS